MKPPDLSEQRVLLFLINRSTPDEVGVLAGRAYWSGTRLEVRPDHGGESIFVRPVDVERGAFPPDELSRTIANKAVAHVVGELAQGVRCCIPMFVSDLPKDAEVLMCLFAGLAQGSEGEALIMRS